MDDIVRRQGAAWLVGGLLVAILIGSVAVLAFEAPFFILVVANTLMLFGVTLVLPKPRLASLFSPVGMFATYLALAAAVVPLLWRAGWAKPWDEVVADPVGAAGLTTIGVGVCLYGMILGRSREFAPSAELTSDPGRLSAVLGMGLGGGLAGYLVLAATAGGPSALVHTLGDRRDLMAGTGPLRAFLVVSGVACIYGVLHRSKTGPQRALTWLCGLTYIGTTLAVGSRLQAIVLVVALICVQVRQRRTSPAFWTKIAILGAAVVPASTFYAYRVRSELTYGSRVDVVDSSSTTSAISSVVGPFASGGLDTIRTTGVLVDRLPLVSFDPNLFLGSIANVVPRTIWPDKPPGSSTQFSEQYFPTRWEAGTGVPPSLPAEMFHTFGFAGGLAALAAFGFVLMRTSSRLLRSHSVFATLFAPLLVADSIQLAKAGSDGFIRTIVIHMVAVAVMTILARYAHTTTIVRPSSVAAPGGQDTESLGTGRRRFDGMLTMTGAGHRTP